MIPRTIVVPLDGSELAQQAVGVADPLARRIGADLLLLTVAESDDLKRNESYLDAVAALVVDVPVTTRVVAGSDPAGAIARCLAEEPDRVACMTTHGRGRLRWAVAGSIAETVIHDATQPLLLVGPNGRSSWSDPPGQIVVCVDGSPASEAVVLPACAWAKALGGELTLAFVGHPLDVEDAKHPDAVFEPLAEVIRGEGVTFHVRYERSSFVAGALLDIAEEPPATMLVMAAHARTGLARMALGSVTMGVLNTATCPVLVTPPHAKAD